MQYLLGLGSNLGDRKSALLHALSLLSGYLSGMSVSDIYESEAMLLPETPQSWDTPYLNACVTGFSELQPIEFLAVIQSIEKALGRRERGKWAPRALDIDILLVDSLTIDSPDLKIPHPGLSERDFVLVPALQIWRDAWHPSHKKSLCELTPSVNTNLKKYAN